MSWRELLNREIEQTYKVTQDLIDLVDEDQLDWKPATGANWMTMGQLLMHITTASGMACRGFATGDWGLPDGVDMAKLPPEEMIPPAEKLPTIDRLSEAKRLLAEDKELALSTLREVSDEDLRSKPAPAPWDPTEMILGHRMLQMVDHLRQHKGQLFYYLKLQGKPVNTNSLWGM